eukprot:1763171-Amphidinium_carterae.1
MAGEKGDICVRRYVAQPRFFDEAWLTCPQPCTQKQCIDMAQASNRRVGTEQHMFNYEAYEQMDCEFYSRATTTNCVNYNAKGAMKKLACLLVPEVLYTCTYEDGRLMDRPKKLQ